MVGLRHRVDVVDITRLDHRTFANIAKQSELAPFFLWDFAVGAAEQNVRLDADRTQLFHRMLGRLGFQFARARNVGQERQVDVDHLAARQIVLDLADRLEERQALDVADSAADLAQHEVVVVIARPDEILDRIGDVRNDLDGRAEIITAALLCQDVLIDATRCDVVLFGRRAAP